MRLQELISEISAVQIIGDTAKEISGVCFDSRKVMPENIFVAICGAEMDGHHFISGAIEKKATAILCEKLPETLCEEVTYIKVNDSSSALGIVASQFYGNPSRRMKVAGVTGTNGKTTIATLLYTLVRRMGYKAGLLSTVCNYVEDEAIPADHTTPDPVQLNSLLARMVEAGCDYAFMEVSSHAVDQKRIAGIDYDGAIFTNLTRDHLDYHKTMENYLKAKKGFFDALKPEAFALTNIDDRNGMVMVQNTRARVRRYGLQGVADYKGKVIENSFEGMQLAVDRKEISTHFVGRFNASNLLAVYGAAIELGLPSEEVLVAMTTLRPVDGRFDTMRTKKGTVAIIDYAHTPDALTNVIDTINSIRRENHTNNRLITVVGCGGNRDKGKRPIMAREAVNGSDIAILTSDNPRMEKPSDILADMVAGLNANEKETVIVIEDRREAIRKACETASASDVILIAGKGHETYQDIMGTKHHFSDKEEVANAL